jgi:AmmeMemoRadiSam system protein A
MLPLPDAAPIPIVSAERRRLLEVARRSIVTAVAAGHVPDLYALPLKVRRRCGVFVTLRLGRRLRGCIGQPDSPHPLEQTVIRCAALAALHDPRFPSLRQEEITVVEIEISVLSEPVPAHPDQVEVGRHGLAVTSDPFRGLLLPQVAQEFGWDRERFLAETCRKAGLDPDAWKHPGTRIEIFTAEVFAESEFQAGGASHGR